MTATGMTRRSEESQRLFLSLNFVPGVDGHEVNLVDFSRGQLEPQKHLAGQSCASRSLLVGGLDATACSIRDVAAVTDGRLRFASLPPLDGELGPFGRIVTEINDVSDGDVYWPLPDSGDAAGGFVEGAFSRGAQGVVVCERRIEPWAGRFVLEVADSENSLFDLAAWSRQRWAGTVVIAVQTHGRPRLGGWIAGVLQARFSRTRRLTVTGPAQWAAAVCNWSRDTEFGVVEIDAASTDTIAQAARLCCPQIGVISAMGNTTDNENAKWEPVKEGLAALTAAIPPEGWLVTDGDEPELDELACVRRCHLMRVGRDPSCDVAATNVCDDAGRTIFQIRGTQFSFAGEQKEFPAVLAALGVARITGLSPAEIAVALATIDTSGLTKGHAA